MKKVLVSLFAMLIVLTTASAQNDFSCGYDTASGECYGTCPSGEECVLVQPEVCICVISSPTPEPEPAPALTPIGLIALAGSLGLIAAVKIRRR